MNESSENPVDWQERLGGNPTPIENAVGIEDYRVKLTSFRDNRGNLTVLQDVEFLAGIRRVFFVYGSTLGSIRGDHAHFDCHQVLIASSGWTDVYVESPLRKHFIVRIDTPEFGLVIPPRHWACQYRRSNEAVLTVLASHLYSESDYIRNYSAWEELISS